MKTFVPKKWWASSDERAEIEIVVGIDEVVEELKKARNTALEEAAVLIEEYTEEYYHLTLGQVSLKESMTLSHLIRKLKTE